MNSDDPKAPVSTPAQTKLPRAKAPRPETSSTGPAAGSRLEGSGWSGRVVTRTGKGESLTLLVASDSGASLWLSGNHLTVDADGVWRSTQTLEQLTSTAAPGFRVPTEKIEERGLVAAPAIDPVGQPLRLLDAPPSRLADQPRWFRGLADPRSEPSLLAGPAAASPAAASPSAASPIAEWGGEGSPAAIDASLRRQAVTIERVAIDRWVEPPPGAPQSLESLPGERTEDGVLIVPVYEEVLVVTKRFKLKEEIRITRREVRERVTGSVSRQTRPAGEPTAGTEGAVPSADDDSA